MKRSRILNTILACCFALSVPVHAANKNETDPNHRTPRPTSLQKAPRPNAPDPSIPNNSSPVAPPTGSCDNAAIVGLLGTIKSNINTCCNDITSELGLILSTIIMDNASTWTVLGDFNTTTHFVGSDVAHALDEIDTQLIETFTTTTQILDIVLTLSNLPQEIIDTLTHLATFSVSVTVDLTGVYTTLSTDFGGTWTVLADIQNSVTSCCAQTQLDFAQTWTVLGNFNTTTNFVGFNIASALDDIKTEVIHAFGGTFTALNADFQGTWSLITADANGTFSSLATGFNGTFSTLNADFQGSYSTLQAIINEQNGTFTALNADFQGTWSLITADANGTFSSLTTGFNDTFSTLNADFQGTWSLIVASSNSANFQGTYTVLQTIINDLDGTFTVLGEIGSTLGKGATISGTLLSIYDTIVSDANGTFSSLATGFNGTFSALQADFNDTWSLLGDVSCLGTGATITGTLCNIMQTINSDFQSTFTVLNADFQGTWSLIVASSSTANFQGTYTVLQTIINDLDGTFTVLGEIGSILGQGATISGTLLSIYDTVVSDFQSTFTELNADFQGTWSLIVASSSSTNFQGTYSMLQTIINDENGTSTLLGEIGSTLGQGATITGTLLSIYNTIVNDANGTFSSLATGFNGTFSALQADFNDTWSLLGDVSCLGTGATITGTLCNIMQTINSDFQGTFTALNADFQGTWSLIVASSSTANFQGTYSMLQTIINDENGTFTLLGEIGFTLGQGATITGTLLSIYNTIVNDANGTFSSLATGFNGTFSALQADFNDTWSLLGDVSCLGTGATITGTLCNIMQTINSDFQGTFTALNADFQGTWSLIVASSSTANFQGTYSMLQTIINDENGTFTLLGEIGSILGQGATISGTLLNIYDTIVSDFQSTFTALNADFQGTWSLIVASSNSANFQGTYTVLQTIINDLDGTFTVLGEIGSILGKGATISGTLLSIYDTIVNDANGTFSALQADFNGTWSLLGDVSCLGTGATITGTLCNIMQTINNDFSGTFTALNADFQGTWSLITSEANGTFSTLNADFQGSYSMLQTIINDQSGTFSILNADFQGTWSLITADSNGTFSALQADFNDTWSLLGDVSCLGTGATITGTLCNIMQTINSDFSGTFSTLAADFGGTWSLIVADANGTFSSVAAGFNGTFSTLNTDFQGSYSMLQTIINDQNGTFSALNADFQGTWSLITADSNGTFSALQADFNGTWSLLGNVSCLGTGATITGTLCNIMQTINSDFSGTFSTLAADFGGTWSLIVADANGTFSSIAAGFNGTFSTLNSDFQGSYSMLQTIINDVNGTFTALNADFQGTWSLIVADSNGTFSRLVADANGTFSAIAAGFNGTFSTLNADFQGSYSMLQTIINDAQGTFSALNADFQGTWSLIVADANGTFSSIAAGFNGTFSTLNADFQGTWSLITADFNATIALITADFNSTWTLITADFEDTWTILGDVGVILGQGATISGTLLDIIETTTILYQNICSPIVINPSPFTTTYTITQPGRYITPYNLTFNPVSPQPAILITSTVVELDFLCSTLEQGNLTSGVNAVSIANGFNDIYIHNGTIEYFTGIGIAAAGNQRLQIEDTLTFSCDTGAIQLISAAESLIKNCSMLGCCQGATGNIVLNMPYCTDVNVEGCILNGNGINTKNLLGVSVANSLKCKFQNIAVNDNIAGADFRAYDINQSTLCAFENCETKNCQSQASNTDSAARGFVLETGATTANFFSNCVAMGLMASATVDGFLSATSCNDNLFLNCQSSLHTTTNPTGIANGFQVVNNMRNELHGCIAHYNTASLFATGFQINNCSNTLIEDCEAQSQNIITAGASVGAFTAVSGSPFANGATAPNSVAFSPLASGNLFAAVANEGNNSITTFVVNPSTGSLTQAPGSPLVTPLTPLQFLACSPITASGNLFIAASGQNANQIAVYQVNQSTGALTAISGSPFSSANVFSIAFSPVIDGNLFAATVNQAGLNGSITIYNVNQTTGAFTTVANAGTGSSTFPEGVALSPILPGNQLLVASANFGSNNISVFMVNPVTGSLTSVVGSPFSAGNGPISIAFSPIVAGNLFAAVTNDNTNTVSVYSVNLSTGVFTQVSGSPFTVNNANPKSIAFSPLINGNLFATVGYTSAGNISVYNVNIETGNFTAVSGNPFSTGGSQTVSVAFSPLVQGNLFSAAVNGANGTTAMFKVTLPSIGANSGSIGFWSFQNSGGASTGCKFKANESDNNGLGFRLDISSTGANTDTAFINNVAVKNATNYNTPTFPLGAIQSGNTTQLNGATFGNQPWCNIAIT